MTTCRVEFVIEPFSTDGELGSHVRAGIAAMEARGLAVIMGPFGSLVEGATEDVSAAISSMVQAAIVDGADRVLVEVTTQP
ncbi:MAG: thiamine-binding protein [Acidimicrobiia bacterium]|nr:thiamine-binding protein [Acidimicrobiia bacterium]